jgi:hypothetical protein
VVKKYLLLVLMFYLGGCGADSDSKIESSYFALGDGGVDQPTAYPLPEWQHPK